MKRILLAGLLGLLCAGLAQAADAEALLNFSYDVSREFFKDYNQAFLTHRRAGAGQITIRQSHGASSAQARAVADGLEADVVTLNQISDMDFLVDKGLLQPDWARNFPHDSVPYHSTIVFLVRKGNPKGIKDWSDLLKPGVQVVLPSPKTSGNGRYGYMAAWAWAAKRPGGSDAGARQFVQQLFQHVPVLDAGGRAATTTFGQNGIGDVLLTFENEAYLSQKELGADKFELVYPSASIDAGLPVAVIYKNAQKHGTVQLATDYLSYLYSSPAQEIIAAHYLRPLDPVAFQHHASSFGPLKLYAVKDVFGSWSQLQQRHFSDGGIFDQIYLPHK